MKVFSLLFFLTMCCFTHIMAQNIETSTIEWSCSSTFTTNPGVITEEVTKVVSSQETITWYDNTGAPRQILTVDDAFGSWNNVEHNGSIIFNVTSGNDRGIVQFQKMSGSTVIRIQIIAETEVQLYELTVTSLTSL